MSWRPLKAFDRARLSPARVQAHFAAQWLARVARAYVPARPDDGHTNFGWDDRFGGFTTHALPSGARLGLKVADLRLVFFDATGEIADPLALDGRRDADARAWLGRHAAANGYDPATLDARLPYGMPAHPIAAGGAYAAADASDMLADLAAWFSNADALLAETRRKLVERKLNVPPVRCWPHHFDLDTLVTLAPGRTMGVGFCPGDGHYDEPYFYVSLYPGPAIAALPRLPAIGHWHAKDFTAAIGTASLIVEARDQKTETEAFLHAAVEAAINTLG